MHTRVFCLVASFVYACSPHPGGESDAGLDTSGISDVGDAATAADVDSSAPTGAPPLRHTPGPARARRGATALADAQGVALPWPALRNLWVAWGQPGLSEAAYWEEFASRYGFVPAPDGGPPIGVVEVGSQGTLQCATCHTDRVAGQVIEGAGNGRLRLSDLYDDLVRLAAIAPNFGVNIPAIPQVWHDAYADRTGAPGATDAFGMAMTLAAEYAPGAAVNTRLPTVARMVDARVQGPHVRRRRGDRQQHPHYARHDPRIRRVAR